MRGLSSTAAPMHHLLHKDRDFTWTPQCQQAFNSLQKALTEAPVLTPQRHGHGCSAGSGGAREGESASRAEILAMVAAIKHFKYYLCGRPFTVRTDHSALQWLMSFREPDGQVIRWIETLQSYAFTVVHRAGASHANANALSRRPCTHPHA